jgi:molecular chaperone GrpE (heat shock protein)
MDRPDILLDHKRRISTLEGIASETRDTLGRLDSRMNNMEARIDARLNALTQLVIGNFALTLLTAIGIVVAVILRL